MGVPGVMEEPGRGGFGGVGEGLGGFRRPWGDGAGAEGEVFGFLGGAGVP